MSSDNTEPLHKTDLNDGAVLRDAFRIYEHMALGCKLNGSIKLHRVWENQAGNLETVTDKEEFLLLANKVIDAFCFECINCTLTAPLNRAYVRDRRMW